MDAPPRMLLGLVRPRADIELLSGWVGSMVLVLKLLSHLDYSLLKLFDLKFIEFTSEDVYADAITVTLVLDVFRHLIHVGLSYNDDNSSPQHSPMLPTDISLKDTSFGISRQIRQTRQLSHQFLLLLRNGEPNR